MTSINIQSIPVGSFASLWSPLFLSNKNRCFELFEKMRFHLPASLKNSLLEGMRSDDPFTFIWNGFCWENVIIATFILNGESLRGRYKILTNSLAEKYHFVIFDDETNTIFDPTYEKHQDVELLSPETACKGTDCTKIILGESCFFFDLDHYLQNFSLGNSIFNSQLREYGDRFLASI